MKRLYAVFLFAAIFSLAHAQREYGPQGINGYGLNYTSAADYCQNATATALTFSWYNGFCSSTANNNIPITITWYSNTTSSTSGGTLLSTLNTNATVTSSSYTPSTAVAGVLYYYAIVSWNNGTYCYSGGSITTGPTNPVTIHAPPAPAITISQNPICSGNATVLTADAGGPQTGQNYTYAWAATYNAPATTYNYLTTYSVSTGTLTANDTYTLTVTDPNNCTASTVATVTVHPTPVASLSVSPSTICSGNSAALTAGETGGVSHFWYTWAATANPPTDNNNTVVTSYSVSVSPTATDTYTLTVTDNNNCVGTAVKTITVNSTPTVTVSSAPSATICNGQNITLTANGASTYVWSPSASLSDPNISDPVAAPSTSANYTVIGTAANTCTATATYSVTVNSTPTITVSSTPSATICNGQNTTLTANGASTYVWSPSVSLTNANISNPVAAPTTSANYTVTGTGANSCTATATYSVSVNPTPTVTANATATLICSGTSDTLTGGGASTYSWTGGVADGIGFVPTSTQTYTVTGTDGNSCSSTSAISINVVTPQTPTICAVTVDSLSNYNVIVWDKTSYITKDTFFIYRDTANNNFALIGKVPFDSLSQFTDTLRSLYAANGDPNATTWKYKIAVKDTCGNISAMSPYHKTLFIQNNIGNFNWNDYLIEGQSVPVPALQNYLFQRDNLSNGNWQTIQTLSASSLSYTDAQYATYQSTATWRVITKWTINCIPTIIDPKNPLSMATTVNNSKSNHFRTSATTSVNTISLENLVSVFPNPNNGVFNLKMNQFENLKINSIEICNIMGECINRQIIKSPNQQIDLNSAPNGIYFAHIKTERGTVVKKIIISH